MNCPCGRPGAWRIWEAPIIFCARHGRAWLASEEKKTVVAAITSAHEVIGPPPDAREIPEAKTAILRFVARCERDGKWRVRLWRWAIAKILGRRA